MVSKPWQDGSFSNEEDSTYPVDRTMDYVYDADVVNDLIDNNISYIIVSDPTDNKEMQVIQMATAFIWLLLTFFGIIGLYFSSLHKCFSLSLSSCLSSK